MSKKRLMKVVVLLFILICSACVSANLTLDSGKSDISIPLQFIPNKGQFSDDILFSANSAGLSVFFEQDRVGVVLDDYALFQEFIGSNSQSVVGEQESGTIVNYYVGNDASKWQSGLLLYEQVRYANLYKGIDLIYEGNNNELKYSFEVKSNADPSQIILAYDGAEKLSIDSEGNLNIHFNNEVMVDKAPIAFQSVAGKVIAVDVKYVLLDDDKYSFEIGDYDRSHELIIDPSMIFTTLLGGSLDDLGFAMTVDSSGNVYVATTSDSDNFPVTVGAVNESRPGGVGKYAITVSKLNPTGTALVYSTYFGGTNDDDPWGIEVDASGNAYIAGTTSSTNFPTTPGAFNTTGTGVFVFKLGNTGSLVYSTLIGPGYCYDLDVDSSGYVYITGQASTGFPTTPGAFNKTSYGVFVTKLNSDGSDLEYSTFIGNGKGYDIKVDSLGDAYVYGSTSSTLYPVTSGAYDESYNGGDDVFVTKLNSTGSGLIYSTFVGSTGDEFIDYGAFDIDSAGNAYFAGRTDTDDYPVTDGAYDSDADQGANYWVFVSKLNPTGTDLVYSTYLEGDYESYAGDLAVDSRGNAYVVGYNYDDTFPITTNAYSSGHLDEGWRASYDIFLARLNQDGSHLDYSTYFYGDENDDATAVYVDDNQNVYVLGWTWDTSVFNTTSGVINETSPGGADAIIIKMHFDYPITNNYGSNYGTTDFSTITDMESVSNLKLATDYGSVAWSGTVNVSSQNFDDYANIGSRFVSFDMDNLDSSINSTAVVNLSGMNCGSFYLYHATGFFQNATALIESGSVVASQADIGGNCTDDTICQNVQCADGYLSFTAMHFDGFGGGDGPSVPEFSDLTLLLALVIVISGFILVKKNGSE